MTHLTNRHLVAATSGVFIAGSAIFAFNLELMPAASVLAGCAGALALAFTSRGKSPDGFLGQGIDYRLLAACVAAALAIYVVGGQGHFFFANNDWLIRDAVLSDLVNQGAPTLYRYEGADYLLRAPLGMYMIPALVGRVFGLFSAHLTQLAQNAFLLSAILYVLGSLAPGRRAPLIALFLVFSGLNIIPTVALAIQRYVEGYGFWIPTYTEVWFKWFAYSSHATQMFFVPNHMSPGWWFAALALLNARRQIDLAHPIVMVAAMMFWSPLAVLAAPLIVLFLAARAPLTEVFAGRNWLAAIAGCLFIPLAMFLTSAAETVPGEWLVARDGFAITYLVFLAIAIPHAAFALGQWSLIATVDRGLLVAAVAILLIIPIYSFGPFNDLAMRGSIAPLAILAFVFAYVVVQLDRVTRPVARFIAIAIVAVGCFTPAFEVMRGFTRHRFAISDCNLLSAWYETDHSKFPSNYLAPATRAPGWLIATSQATPRLELENRSCWPDHPEPEFIHNNK